MMSYEVVEVANAPQVIAEVVSNTTTVTEVIVSPVNAVEIIGVGPQGAKGDKGDSAVGAGFQIVPFSGLAAGQIVTLGRVIGSFAQLTINGLVEDNANFTVSGVMLTIPPGLVWNGAACVFRYSNL